MKTKKTYLLIAFLLPMSLLGQMTYQHYLDSTYAWFEYTWSPLFPGGPPCLAGGDQVSYYRYHVVGTDTIDNHEWYQVHSDWIHYTYCGTVGPPTVVVPGFDPDPFSFRIREDSTGKIWLRDSNGTIKMLYDFGPALGVGDTLWMSDYQDSCVIDQIDSVYFGTDARARYRCACDGNPIYPRFVVEGVGSNIGFNLLHKICLSVNDVDRKLVCATKGAHTIPLDSNLTCGNPGHHPVGIEDPSHNALTVHWSEADQQLLLVATQPLRQLDWRVYDLSGRLLVQGRGYTGRIDIPNVSAGMYVFAATYQGGQTVLRFVKE